MTISVERHYRVVIAAPDGVFWNLWLPSPVPNVGATSVGEATVLGIVETPVGPLVNVTGSGQASLDFTTRSLEFTTEPLALNRGFGLTGLEREAPNWTLAVWRGGSDSAANVTVHGGSSWKAETLESSVSCGGVGYSGPLTDGWNHLRALASDCVILISSFPFPLGVPTLLFLAGGVTFALSQRRRRGDEGQFFVPPEMSRTAHGRDRPPP